MKTKYLLAALIAVAVLPGCKVDDIKLYNHISYVYLDVDPDNPHKEFSFAFYPGQESVNVTIPVKLIGNLTNYDRKVSLKSDPANTTAQASDYTLPQNIVLEANEPASDIVITFHNSQRLKENKYKLRLMLEESDDFKCGPSEMLYIDIEFSDMISRPEWWTNWVGSSFLGAYSDTRYRFFIEATGEADMTGKLENELRTYAMTFQSFLDKGRSEGRVFQDEYGEINVPSRGWW